jgi:hypothetical protein
MAQRNGMDDDLGLHAAFTGRVRMTHDVRAPCLRLALVCASRVRVLHFSAFAHACWRVGWLLPPPLTGVPCGAAADRQQVFQGAK